MLQLPTSDRTTGISPPGFNRAAVLLVALLVAALAVTLSSCAVLDAPTTGSAGSSTATEVAALTAPPMSLGAVAAPAGPTAPVSEEFAAGAAVRSLDGRADGGAVLTVLGLVLAVLALSLLMTRRLAEVR
jgi:hypothetical protein